MPPQHSLPERGPVQTLIGNQIQLIRRRSDSPEQDLPSEFDLKGKTRNNSIDDFGLFLEPPYSAPDHRMDARLRYRHSLPERGPVQTLIGDQIQTVRPHSDPPKQDMPVEFDRKNVLRKDRLARL